MWKRKDTETGANMATPTERTLERNEKSIYEAVNQLLAGIEELRQITYPKESGPT